MIDDTRVMAALRSLVPECSDQPLTGIEYLPGGYTNQNYRIELGGSTYALRLMGPNVPNRGERRYLDISAAPDVVAYDPEDGGLLTHWIEGWILAEAPPHPAEAGAYLADLHRQIPVQVRRYDFAHEITNMLFRADNVDPDVVECFEDLAWAPAQWRGCHNDLNPWNIIRVANASGTQRFRTLDWESAGDNDPLFDAVGLGVGLGWGLEETAVMLAAYQQSGLRIDATPARIRDTFRAFLIREYAWAVWQLADGNDRAEIRAQAARSLQALTDWDQ